MKLHCSLGCLLILTLAAIGAGDDKKAAAISPKDGVLPLFNGKDLTGLYTWLKDTKTEDPRKVFTVDDGMIHVSGDGVGYVATEKEYRDYHLIVEYKWGKRTDGGKYVRNSGILLHAHRPGRRRRRRLDDVHRMPAGPGLRRRPDRHPRQGRGRQDHPGHASPARPCWRPTSGTRWKKGGEAASVHRAGSSGGRSTTRTSRNCSTPAARTTWRARWASGPRSSASARGNRITIMINGVDGQRVLRRLPRGRQDPAAERGLRDLLPQVRAAAAEVSSSKRRDLIDSEKRQHDHVPPAPSPARASSCKTSAASPLAAVAGRPTCPARPRRRQRPAARSA